MAASNGANAVEVGHGHQLINQTEEEFSRTNIISMLQMTLSQPRNYNGSDLGQARRRADIAWSPHGQGFLALHGRRLLMHLE